MQEIFLDESIRSYKKDEEYKILQRNMEFFGTDKRVLVFTSVAAGEGKSSVSISLAASLVKEGKKVLFLDADLRKSSLNSRCKAETPIYGLSHFLSGQKELLSVIYKVSGSDLEMITAGVLPPNPAELLGNEKFQTLIKTARANYDYVMIDSPPLGRVIDAAIIAKQCDAAVLVAAVRGVSYKEIGKVRAQLEKTGCPILGMVLNKVNVKKDKKYGKIQKKLGKYRI